MAKKKIREIFLGASSIGQKLRLKVGILRAQLHKSPHRSFRLTKKYKQSTPPESIIGSFRLFWRTLTFIKLHASTILPLTGLYVLLYWLIVGFPSQEGYQNAVDTAGGDSMNVVALIAAQVVGASRGTFLQQQTEVEQLMTVLLGLVFWFSFIWAIRHLVAGNGIRVREALYNSSAPLVTTLVVLFVIALQLVPASIGALILFYVFGSGSVDGVEAMLFSIGGFLLIVLSLYFVLHSLLALIIVTLPNMYPLESLKNAKQLALNRRVTLLRRLVGLTFCLSLVWVVVLLPLIIINTFIDLGPVPLVPAAIDIMTAFNLPIAAVYLYLLYRDLL